MNCNTLAKGQTISEWIDEVIASPKIQTKNCQDFWRKERRKIKIKKLQFILDSYLREYELQADYQFLVKNSLKVQICDE